MIIPVFPPREIVHKYPEAQIFIGLLNYNNVGIIENQLKSLNFTKIHYGMDAFIFVYMTMIAHRNCDPEIFAKSISLLNGHYPGHNNRFSPPVSYMTTQKMHVALRSLRDLCP